MKNLLFLLLLGCLLSAQAMACPTGMSLGDCALMQQPTDNLPSQDSANWQPLPPVAMDDSRNKDRGIGGTGVVAQQEQQERGIGGTGIVGTITGFGSIWVNGVRVTYDTTTPVVIDGKASKIDNLRIGQTAIIEALGENDLALVAQRVTVNHALVGPVSRSADGNYAILDVPFSLPEGSPAPKPGEWLAVSGLPDSSGKIIATRLDTAADTDQAVTRIIRDGVVFRARGRVDSNGKWRVETVAPIQPDPFEGRMARILVEAVAEQNSVTLGGVQVSLPERFSHMQGGDVKSRRRVVLDTRPAGAGRVSLFGARQNVPQISPFPGRDDSRPPKPRRPVSRMSPARADTPNAPHESRVNRATQPGKMVMPTREKRGKAAPFSVTTSPKLEERLRMPPDRRNGETHQASPPMREMPLPSAPPLRSQPPSHPPPR